MPPVEIVNSKGARRRLKFIRNTAYEGQDYGPDHGADEADVDRRWATIFLQNGRAVEVEATAKKGPGDGTTVQVRDPVAEHRDPVLPLTHGTEKKK